MKMTPEKYTDDTFVLQEYWDNGYENLELFEAKDNLTKWLDVHFYSKFPISEQQTLMEIGCYPGRYLIGFAKHHFKVSGIDLTPHIKRLNAWFQSNKLNYSEFVNESVLTYQPNKKFDVVCSFGFIEHFANYKEIIQKHIDWSKHIVIITTPNFRGKIQYRLHRFFDKENLDRHNVEAMNPDEWKELLEKQGYTVTFCGYFGGYDFWYDSKVSLPKYLLRVFYKQIINRILKVVLRFDSKHFSAFAGVIAYKK